MYVNYIYKKRPVYNASDVALWSSRNSVFARFIRRCYASIALCDMPAIANSIIQYWANISFSIYGILCVWWISEPIVTKAWSTLAHVMTCNLATPNYYLHLCWIIINGVLWNSFNINSTGSTQDIDEENAPAWLIPNLIEANVLLMVHVTGMEMVLMRQYPVNG